MGITPLPVETVYQTYAQLILVLFYQMIVIINYCKSFAYYSERIRVVIYSYVRVQCCSVTI